jgi:hypothetical protein
LQSPGTCRAEVCKRVTGSQNTIAADTASQSVPSADTASQAFQGTGADTPPSPETPLKPAHFTVVTGAFPVTIVKCVGQPLPYNTVRHNPGGGVCGYGIASVPSADMASQAFQGGRMWQGKPGQRTLISSPEKRWCRG